MSEVQFITLQKADAKFDSYIWGRFSSEERAIPTRSLNVNTETESVTFEIVPKRKLSWFKGILQALRIRNLYLSLVPLFLVLAKNFMDETLPDELLAGLSCLGVLFVQLGMEMANDVQDHIRGLDRIHPRSGNFAIYSGWLPAWKLQNYARGLLLFGVLLGLPSLLFFPKILWIVLPLGILGLGGVLSHRVGLKYRAISEVIVFLMFGPILTTAYQISFGGEFDFEVIIMGVITGWIAVFEVHLKNFSQIIVNDQSGFDSTIVRLGFDRSKKFLMVWWIFLVLLVVAYHGFYLSEDWMWINALVLVLVSLPFFQAVTKLNTPIGSKMEKAMNLGMRLTKIVLTLWVLENFVTLFFFDGYL